MAERHDTAREALIFYAEIAELQGRVADLLRQAPGTPPTAAPVSGERAFHLDSLFPARQLLVELVMTKGTDVLSRAAKDFDEIACRQALRAYLTEQDRTSPRSMLARVLLQPAMFGWAGGVNTPKDRAENVPMLPLDPDRVAREFERTTEAGSDPGQLDVLGPTTPLPSAKHACCPRCGHAPQAGCLRPQGDGMALSLVCSLCLWEWTFPRGRCPACGETDEKKIAYYCAPELEHLQVQVCESCQKYFHSVNLSKDRNAVPDVDEVAALPLDVWAHERGFQKIHLNLVGI